MDVVIAGGHGQIARRLIRLLARDGHTARALIRNPDHAADIEADGGVPIVCDLEQETPDAAPRRRRRARLRGRRRPRLGRRAQADRRPRRGARVRVRGERGRRARFVIVSSIGAQDPDAGPEAMRPYLHAKADADRRGRERLDWTIVRPGSLTDDPGTGRVEVSTALDTPRAGAARRRRAGPARDPAGAQDDRADLRARGRRRAGREAVRNPRPPRDV